MSFYSNSPLSQALEEGMRRMQQEQIRYEQERQAAMQKMMMQQYQKSLGGQWRVVNPYYGHTFINPKCSKCGEHHGACAYDPKTDMCEYKLNKDRKAKELAEKTKNKEFKRKCHRLFFVHRRKFNIKIQNETTNTKKPRVCCNGSKNQKYYSS